MKNNFKIGFGYDVHRFAEGRKLFLGGIEVPHHQGLLGHSDADVLLHAICDALLGALALRDIGYHFSDKDPQFKNIDSKILLQKTYELIQAKGYEIGNIDSTIVAEEPKINPFIPQMIEVISKILNTESENISIKATTHEKMGALGNGEGMAAHAVCLLVKI